MSNIDFFQIGALKVFAELGALIEEDEKHRTLYYSHSFKLIYIAM